MRDREQDPDRWCSQTPWGQEFWQILSQWVWNLRLELGQHCAPIPLRTTTFAEACEPLPASGSADQGVSLAEERTPASGSVVGHDLSSEGEVAYGPPQWARPSFTRGFPGSAFLPQPDGTLLCPNGKVLTMVERRQERAGSVRVFYIANLDDCRTCPLRAQCQNRRARRARRVSAVYWPLPGEESPPAPPPPSACSPVLWRDWPRCSIRRQWINTVRSQTVAIRRGTAPPPDPSQDPPAHQWTRSQRAHWRLSWEQRLARNARPASAPPVTITLHGLPAAFAQQYGFELRKAS